MPTPYRKWMERWNGRPGVAETLLEERSNFFKRYLYRNYHTFASITHRFNRRVTRVGWVILGGTVVAAALGADTNASESYQTFALLACITLTSAICTPWARPKLSLERILPRFGSVGDRLRYQIVIRNESKRAQKALRLVEELPDPRPTFNQFANTPEPGEEQRNWIDRTYGYYRWRWLMARNIHAQVHEQAAPDVPPEGSCTVGADLMPLRRGTLRFTGITIACPDPFGLFRSLRHVPAPQSVLILPKRYPLPVFNLPGSMKYQAGGVAMASSVGESEEFVSLREYRPGDALRRMHWKSFAKLGKPIVKEYQDEFFVRHALVLDTFGDLGREDIFEEAVSVAASLAYTVQNQDSLLDLMFVGLQAYCFTYGRGLGDFDQVLEVLASVQIGEEKHFDALESLVLTHTTNLSGCICIFIAWDAPRQKLAGSLMSRGVPLQVFVVTQNDEPLPLGPMAAEPGNFHLLPLGRIAEKLAAL